MEKIKAKALYKRITKEWYVYDADYDGWFTTLLPDLRPIDCTLELVKEYFKDVSPVPEDAELVTLISEIEE
jgi:hypothetical protein